MAVRNNGPFDELTKLVDRIDQLIITLENAQENINQRFRKILEPLVNDMVTIDDLINPEELVGKKLTIEGILFLSKPSYIKKKIIDPSREFERALHKELNIKLEMTTSPGTSKSQLTVRLLSLIILDNGEKIEQFKKKLAIIRDLLGNFDVKILVGNFISELRIRGTK